MLVGSKAGDDFGDDGGLQTEVCSACALASISLLQLSIYDSILLPLLQTLGTGLSLIIPPFKRGHPPLLSTPQFVIFLPIRRLVNSIT